MIDFRYHLVSIVSIFFALAVGIVLGAGPLKEQVGATLTEQVRQLRDDKTALRAQLDQANADSKAQSQYIQEAAPAVLATRLSGRLVAVVVAPGADGDVVSGMRTALEQAGATVTTTATLQGSWLDTSSEQDRTELGQTLAPSLGIETSPAPALPLVDLVLARSLASAAGTRNPGAEAALTALDDAGLLSVQDPAAGPATGVVVVSGPIAGDTAQDRSRRASVITDLAAALDASAGGTVVVGWPGDAAAAQVTAVSTIRDDSDLSRAVSTVDNGDQPLGLLSAALALAEQYSGRSGSYGFGEGANSVYPPLPSAG